MMNKNHPTNIVSTANTMDLGAAEDRTAMLKSPPPAWRLFIQQYSQNRGALAATIVFLLIAFCALFAP